MSLAGACPAGQVGVRRRGGASSVQALVWNLGTARPDVAGRVLTAAGGRENSKQLICEGESTDAGSGADRLVVAGKVL